MTPTTTAEPPTALGVPGSPYLTLHEAAQYCRRSAKTLANAKCGGRLKAVGFGRRALYTRAELDRWLKEG